MVLEQEIIPLWEWLFPTVSSNGALIMFITLAFGLTLVSLFVAYLRMVILHGPGEAFYVVAKAVATAVAVDFPNTSLRRIGAIARLAILQSLRWRVLTVFLVFSIVLLFAGWFLDTKSDHPARVYLSFVLSATEMLIIGLAIVMSAFSLPQDIKSKTIQTVVTKPVRANEIVIGRIVGFAIVNTVLLVLMCGISYIFVVRGMSHRHVIDPADMVASGSGADAVEEGNTSLDAYHRHDIKLDASGEGITEHVMDHHHFVYREGEGPDAKYVVGPATGALTAKVPVYGKMSFMDRTGRPGEGISVGKEWSYRSYIEGGTLAAAVWTFSRISERDYPDGLPLEMNISVFRTHKGDIVSGILGSITVKNPTTGVSSEPIPFTAREFVLYRHDIPRDLKAVDADGSLRDIDLFEELVDENGRVEIWIQCSERAQYFGMAQADVYIRGSEAMFSWNFVKSYMGIWMQMVIITCFGVMFSTFLSGSVALYATAVIYFVGLFQEFIVKVATGEQSGGGPLESLVRLVTQKNISIDLEMGTIVERIIKGFDWVLMSCVWLGANIFPDFRSFNTSRFVAYGFNIDGNLLAQHFLITFAFALSLSIYGYFFLKAREIAG